MRLLTFIFFSITLCIGCEKPNVQKEKRLRQSLNSLKTYKSRIQHRSLKSCLKSISTTKKTKYVYEFKSENQCNISQDCGIFIFYICKGRKEAVKIRKSNLGIFSLSQRKSSLLSLKGCKSEVLIKKVQYRCRNQSP